MTLRSERRNAYSELATALEEVGLDWVVAAVDDYVANGHRLERGDSTRFESPIRPLTDREAVVALCDAVVRAVIDPTLIAQELVRDLESDQLDVARTLTGTDLESPRPLFLPSVAEDTRATILRLLHEYQDLTQG